MEFEYQSTLSEIPSLVESLSSDQVSELTNTEESFEIDDWSSLSPIIESREQYAEYQYQYQQLYFNQPQHHGYQQQFGYMTPQYSSTPPYNTYYMPSSPVEFTYNQYRFNHSAHQHQQLQETQRIIIGTPSPTTDTFHCNICLKTFKSAANLSRHFASKTHMKRLQSRRLNIQRPRKQKLGSILTDLSDEEKRFLWKLDEEIWQFLRELENEKKIKAAEKNEILPTPPLSPTQKKRDEKRQRREKRLHSEIAETDEKVELIEEVIVKEVMRIEEKEMES